MERDNGRYCGIMSPVDIKRITETQRVCKCFKREPCQKPRSEAVHMVVSSSSKCTGVGKGQNIVGLTYSNGQEVRIQQTRHNDY